MITFPHQDLGKLVEAARHVSWHYSLPDSTAYKPGDMTVCYLDALARADLQNFAALAHAFPLHAMCMAEVKWRNNAAVVAYLSNYGMTPTVAPVFQLETGTAV